MYTSTFFLQTAGKVPVCLLYKEGSTLASSPTSTDSSPNEIFLSVEKGKHTYCFVFIKTYLYKMHFGSYGQLISKACQSNRKHYVTSSPVIAVCLISYFSICLVAVKTQCVRMLSCFSPSWRWRL